jgi:hypothetical protein
MHTVPALLLDSAPADLISLFSRSRCVSAGNYVSTSGSLSVSCPFMSHSVNSSVLMRQQTVINGSCLITKCIFSAAVPLRVSSKKILFKRTTAGRCILSNTDLTLCEVLLSMIVLPVVQVLNQSSGGTTSRVKSLSFTFSFGRSFRSTSTICESVNPNMNTIKKRRVVSLCVW